MPRVHIDVMLKDEILDPQGQAIERALPALGFTGVAQVRVGKHIELLVDDAPDLDAVISEMSAKLLANPVIERFTYRVEA
ncbi:MAG TPA: phosphoribosylformylglycinamidine synthase subunit PurS [Egibacteraceae bacterium]|nr:phosphoribosylformylglycinamidine synthase subunit PurS [Egibacteraceae bacterium]